MNRLYFAEKAPFCLFEIRHKNIRTCFGVGSKDGTQMTPMRQMTADFG